MVSESAGAGSEFKIAVYIKVRDPTEDRLPSVSKYHKISGKWWTVEVTLLCHIHVKDAFYF